MEILKLLLPFLLFIVFGILVAGVVVMAKGGEVSRMYNNKLMQARVLAQAAAILLIVLLVLLNTQ